jgi:hypothetical protein
MKSAKKILMVLAAVFVFGAAAFAPGAATADDGGDETVVDVIEWICAQCGQQFFTFAPDNLAYETDTFNKVVAYQQANWLRFDNRNSIKKCTKLDGAHWFSKDKKKEYKTSPWKIHERRADYIVLKNGGGSVKAKFEKMKCQLCGLEGYNFDGDDLDMATKLTVKDSLNLFNMESGTRIRECGYKLAVGTGSITLKAHLFSQTAITNPKSIQIAEALRNIWYSD